MILSTLAEQHVQKVFFAKLGSLLLIICMKQVMTAADYTAATLLATPCQYRLGLLATRVLNVQSPLRGREAGEGDVILLQVCSGRL